MKKPKKPVDPIRIRAFIQKDHHNALQRLAKQFGGSYVEHLDNAISIYLTQFIEYVNQQRNIQKELERKMLEDVGEKKIIESEGEKGAGEA